MILKAISNGEAGKSQGEVVSVLEEILPTLIVALVSPTNTGPSVTVVRCRQFDLRTKSILVRRLLKFNQDCY